MDAPESLALLRQYYQNGQARIEGDEIIIGHWAIPCKEATNFQINGVEDEFYTNEAIYHYIRISKHEGLRFGPYTKVATQDNLDRVRRIDVRQLNSFLEGKDDHVASIVATAPASYARRVEATREDGHASAELTDLSSLEHPSLTSSTAATALSPSSTAEAAKRPADTDARDDLKRAHRQPGTDATHTMAQDAQASDAATSSSDGQSLLSNGHGSASSLSDKTAAAPALSNAKRAEIIAKRQRKKSAKQSYGLSEATRAITKNELVYESRSSVLQAPGRDFTPLLAYLARHDEAKQRAKGGRSSDSANARGKDGQSGANALQQQKYRRYEQPGQRVDSGGFNVNLAGTHNQDSSMFKSAEKMAKIAAQNATSAAASSSSRKKRTSKTPIIVVPAGMASKLTVVNAKQFLEDGVFIPPFEAAKTQTKAAQVIVNRVRKGENLRYLVTDRVDGFKTADWERVIAVFVSGKEWQFKKWPQILNGKSLVDVFSKHRAFFVAYDDERANQKVANWNCKILKVSATRRHLDQTAVHNFWEALDAWAVPRYPSLRV